MHFQHTQYSVFRRQTAITIQRPFKRLIEANVKARFVTDRSEVNTFSYKKAMYHFDEITTEEDLLTILAMGADRENLNRSKLLKP